MLRASALLGVVLVLGLGSRARAQDLANGKDVFGTCAACHGSNGEGGKQGEYPRLAGQYPNYLEWQIAAYQRGDRVHEQEEKSEGVMMKLTATDIRNVLAYLTSVQDLGEETPDAGRPENDK